MSKRRPKRAKGGSLASQLKASREVNAPRLDPLLYVALHTGNAGDVSFYVERCLGAESLHLRVGEDGALLAPAPSVAGQVNVLELGCGAGRVSLPLLEGGARVVGVDLHQGLLELLERTARERGLDQELRLICQDMRTLQLKERFDYVLISYNTLYCALSWDDQVDCLARAAQHLKPNGRLIIDGYALPDPGEFVYESDEVYEPLTVVELPQLTSAGGLPDELWRLGSLHYLPLTDEGEASAELTPPERSEDSVTLSEALATQALEGLEPLDLGGEEEALSPEEEARLVGVEERDTHDQPAQRCDVHYRFRSADGSTREEVIKHRYLYPAQLPEMLDSAGLSLDAWWPDFEAGSAEELERCEQWALSATLRGQRGLR